MGETGPCGPCTEIHFDRIGGRNVADLVNRDDPTVIEIWNLVFMQFNRETDGSLRSLPAKHVDTGMGLERLVSVLQNVKSNYDTDIFIPIFEEIQRVTGARPYQGKVGAEDTDTVDMAYRVVADHIRTLTFAITDGAVPGNEGRNYVLRRILRRAVRYGRQILKAPSGFFSKLVTVVVKQMSSFFPEIERKAKEVEEILRDEESSFERTLSKGLEHFAVAASKAASTKVIAGEDVFLLYDTYGFPLDLTQLMAAERGFTADMETYNALMQKKVEDSRTQTKLDTALHLDVNATAHLNKLGLAPTDDSFKYVVGDISATIKAIWNGKEFVNEAIADAKNPFGFVLDKTNFYSESGGQTFDVGTISKKGETFNVEEAHVFAGYVLHIGKVTSGSFKLGETVELKIDDQRRKPIMANHTFTHVLNFALRKVLGNGVDQKGSLVDAEKLRFDFSHNKALTNEELKAVEHICNQKIKENLSVYSAAVALSVAQQINGLRAVFGQHYPDPVTIVCVGVPITDLTSKPNNPDWLNYSIELCGGTHLKNSSEAKLFVIVSETGIAKGVRRIIAYTGDGAKQLFTSAAGYKKKIQDGADKKGEDLSSYIATLTTEIENSSLPVLERPDIQKLLQGLIDLKLSGKKNAEKFALQRAEELAKKAIDNKENLIVEELDVEGDRKALNSAMQILREKCPQAAVMLLSRDPKKFMVNSFVGKDLQAKLSAGDWARVAVEVGGGKAGGKAESGQGQADTTDASKFQEAIQKAKAFAQEKLK